VLSVVPNCGTRIGGGYPEAIHTSSQDLHGSTHISCT
jgi:hypothetical protein